jgi:membrane protease YdiL (CAAX protease family)
MMKQKQSRELLVFIFCFFVVWSIRATCLSSIDQSIASDSVRTIYSNLIKSLLWVLPAFGFACWVRKTSPLSYLGFSTLPSIRQWGLYLTAMGLFFGLVIGFETLLGRKTLSMAGISISITVSGFLFHFVSPLIEETMFRGLLMKEFLRLLPGWKANIAISMLFAGIHLPFWLWHDGWTQSVLANTFGVFIFSLLAGWLYQRSHSIWPPTVAHIANNFISTLLIVATA